MKAFFLNFTQTRNILHYVIIMTCSFFLVACNEDDDAEAINNGNESLNVVEVLNTFNSSSSSAVNPSFNTLNAALEAAGLASAVASGQLTLFAPTDEAFAEMGLNESNIASVSNLDQILLYHVLDGEVTSNQLSNTFVATLNGAAIQINLEDGPMINDAEVVRADIKAQNGVIHAIDKVIMPPTMNIVELAQSLAPEFTSLVEAVVQANLATTLADDGPFTVFAPTNAAFQELLDALPYSSISEIPNDVLTNVLLYHVVPGRVYSSDLSNGNVNTLLDETFEVNVNDLTITDFNGGEAGLVPSLLNVQATNGVIHVIDKVILPDLN